MTTANSLLDPRLRGLALSSSLFGGDIGGTLMKFVLTDPNGENALELTSATAKWIGNGGLPEALIDAMVQAGFRPQKGGLAGAGMREDDGSITCTNATELGAIQPLEVESRTGMSVQTVNDVVAFVLGTTRRDVCFKILRFRPSAFETRPDATRTGVFITTGCNSARIRRIPALDGAWVPMDSESGWPGLQIEHANLFEEGFIDMFGEPSGEVGGELMASMGSGVANWHSALQMASPKALRWYLLLTGLTLPLRELRPGPNLIHAIEEAGKDVGPVFDTAAIAGDQYARMVCWAHGASIGAYLRSVLLHNRTDYSEGLWINCPAFCREDVRRLYFEDTPLLERLVSPNAVGQGKRWVDYLSRVPLILSTDPFTVPAGAAMFRGVQSVILGE